MSFADRYQQASFRGVPFRVRSNTRSGGLLLDEHVYPGKKEPANVYVEILGSPAVTFSITGYIVGVDHDSLRDELETALAEQSVGQLRLPLRPAMDVVCASHSSSEDEERLGVTIFQMTFTVAPNQPAGSGSVSTGRELASAAGNLRTAAADDFAATWDLDGPRWVYESGVNSLDVIGGGYIGEVSQSVGVADMSDSALSLYRRNIDSGQDLAQCILDTATSVGGGMTTADGVASMLSVGGPYYESPSVFTTSTAEQIANNSIAVSNLFDRAFVAEAAARAVRVGFDSDTQAGELLGLLDSAVDRISRGSSGEVYRAAKALRSAACLDFNQRGRSAGRLVRVTMNRTDCFENISHTLYSSGANARELIRRNRAAIPHPGFIIPGTTLEAVLDTDGRY